MDLASEHFTMFWGALAFDKLQVIMSSIGVLGAGTWGTALARMLSNSGHDVTVWSISLEEVNALSTTRRHKNLPNCDIPEGIVFTTDIRSACENQDFLLCAVPSLYVRSTIASARPYIKSDQIIVDVAKGIEAETLSTMTKIIRNELSDGLHEDVKIVALSGPTHTEEVAQDLPKTIVSACEDIPTAELVQGIFFEHLYEGQHEYRCSRRGDLRCAKEHYLIGRWHYCRPRIWRQHKSCSDYERPGRD